MKSLEKLHRLRSYAEARGLGLTKHKSAEIAGYKNSGAVERALTKTPDLKAIAENARFHAQGKYSELATVVFEFIKERLGNNPSEDFLLKIYSDVTSSLREPVVQPVAAPQGVVTPIQNNINLHDLRSTLKDVTEALETTAAS